ncbi:DNA polymerase III subunit beta [Aureibacter tunicatorum]|uniref:Beta sliding clamp n=1 Tax=Aureibacter tunicatorum TaxID=866807 RepID=A0AAE3XN58_9BACT|nr:DNA polymerase III subunit beta [Aureibacter tunicatorum]MDR6238950.1 DNA polymerase-3 subunit beta [Aureibacter tunicatorum]BDD05124.1 DNA polymerase III subunit beta [Aureibacter tunicatorum]
MKFIVSSSALLKQLSNINGVVATNTIVPILENFLFEIDGEQGKLTITASDLQTSMITELDIEAKESGSIAVPAKILMDTLKNLPEQPVTFSIEEDSYTIEINSENGRYKLAGENATDFPKAPTVSDPLEIKISSVALSNAINNTIFATSNDDLRPAMTGVFFNINSEGTTFVATDGHRLIRYRRSDVVSQQESSIIIPKKALTLLKSTIPSEDTVVKIEFNPTNAYFEFGNIKMISRLIDEKYPDYENVIPMNNDNHLIIDRLSFLSSLKRIAIYANKTTNQVRLNIVGNTVNVSAEDLDFSNEAKESLIAEHYGNDIEIGFNAKLLIEMLNNMDSDKVNLQLSQPNKAGLMIPNEAKDNENILMLIMPVMLNSYHV